VYVIYTHISKCSQKRILKVTKTKQLKFQPNKNIPVLNYDYVAHFLEMLCDLIRKRNM